MKLFSEKLYHLYFRIGIAIKTLIGIGEIVCGFALVFFSYDTLNRFVLYFVGSEIAETPRDAIWGYIFDGFKNFTATPQAVWAFVFLSHGIVKMLLTGGLWKGKLWAYPASIAIFSLFVVYQFIEILANPSYLMILITAFDIIVIALISHEYWHKRKRLGLPE